MAEDIILDYVKSNDQLAVMILRFVLVYMSKNSLLDFQVSLYLWAVKLLRIVYFN